MRIGLISDTHGLLRDAALAALAGSDRIIHAGDIGDEGLLATLSTVAPTVAVRGNNDVAPWADALPSSLQLRVGTVTIHVLHDIKQLGALPAPELVNVIVAGHSHRPGVERDGDGVLRVNPGSAGRRRFSLPISVGVLDIEGSDVHARIVLLDG